MQYRVLPGVFDPASALEPDAPVVHPEIQDSIDPERRNLIHQQHIHKGDGIDAKQDIERLFASAAERGWKVIAGNFGTGFQDHAPLEPEVALAEWDAEKEKVWDKICAAIPQIRIYEQRTDRNIRVFRLSRVDS